MNHEKIIRHDPFSSPINFVQSSGRRTFLRLMGMFGISAASLLLGCNSDGMKDAEAKEKNNPLQAADATRPLPPLDLAAPAQTVLASFAMG